MKDKYRIERQEFSKIPSVIDMPNLNEIQLSSFKNFLQLNMPHSKRLDQGLHAAFKSMFPITDVHNTAILEYIDYSIGVPKYSKPECIERDMTYAAPLKATLRLTTYEKEKKDGEQQVKDIVSQQVFLGEMPLMTETGTFIINGAERVIVSQLHRSPGVFFGQETHPNGKLLFSSRIIPYRGSWVEFSMDINDILYAHIDRKRKFPASILLRALGFSDNESIWRLFYDSKKITVAKLAPGMICMKPVVHKKTGEVLADTCEHITEEIIENLVNFKVKNIEVLDYDPIEDSPVMENTLRKDPTDNEEDALYRIYTLLRPGDPPNVETARSLVERMFFSPKRYNLGDVGRYRLGQRLNIWGDEETPTVLTRDDFIAILKYMLGLCEEQPGHYTDDIDHLGNRRVRSVGELLSNQFNVGLSRLARTIKERMSIQNDEKKMTPHALINARSVSTVVASFFGSSQLSQFMDQINPLSELTHKRRLSALGPGGLSRERAGFEVRDVHHTHYGRICPIETPEGPNIGLISYLATHARVNEFGFLETPYRKFNKGKITNKIEFLSADIEDKFTVAQANAPLNKDGTFVKSIVKARKRDDYPLVTPDEVDYIDVSTKQLVGVAASLIPFLEHDDANRALMGSNMQRQGVPLMRPKAPIVGTGMEGKVATDSGAMVISDVTGTVDYVSADKIIVKTDDAEMPKFAFDSWDNNRVYDLTKFKRSNQDTCINQRPLVRAGDRVEPGSLLADGHATEKGDLALGTNVLVAFIPWYGYNFEDAIVISERIVKQDVFSSIHIEEFELQVRDTKRGTEELTRELPNVSEEAVSDLDENGIIRVGATIKPGDILVGKVTPKGETELSPEERLLKAIFGEKAGDVRDASLRVPPGVEGVVIDTRVFSRKERDEKTRKRDKEAIEKIKIEYSEKIEKIKDLRTQELTKVLYSSKSGSDIIDTENGTVVLGEGKTFTKKILSMMEFDKLVADSDGPWSTDDNVDKDAEKILLAAHDKISTYQEKADREIEKVQRGDELTPGLAQLVKVRVCKKRKLQVGDKMAGRHGNKGVVAKIVPEEDMPYLADGQVVDIVLNPLGIPSRMNLGQVLETHLGWAGSKLGKYYGTAVFDGASWEEIQAELIKAGLPEKGKTQVFNGRTGEPFEHSVAVGIIYFLKLLHLVADKIHARSIGPYSLVTQQPLGGKAQFGGQRFGEMEVWALEAYGASHILQEMLTVKSDDVQGRSRIYEAIVKGENTPDPGVPESFNVLMKELQSLGLDVQLLKDGVTLGE